MYEKKKKKSYYDGAWSQKKKKKKDSVRFWEGKNMNFIDFSEQEQHKNFTEPAESKELEYKLSQNKLSKSFWETVSAFRWWFDRARS